jgi:glycosyltransferase involved in cell wall biosynthesis
MRFLPNVSCVCPTFARAYLLEEAIESFLRQDYQGEKELIVCNDFSRQTLELEQDIPNVRIINLPERTKNLGEKRNVTYSHATGDVFLTWGDDDIHLPSRISRMVNAMNSSGKEFVYEGPYYSLYNNILHREVGRTSGAHIVTKDLFYKVGGIPLMNSGEDQAFNNKIAARIGRPLAICTDAPQFVYRYSTGRVHVSQWGEDKKDQPTAWERMLQSSNAQVDAGKEPSGLYHLKPHWSKNWVEAVKSAKPKK